MGTGVFDIKGKEIQVGDIVHYRGRGLSTHGKVIEYDRFGYAVLDDRTKTRGRIYSLFNEGIYRIEEGE